MLTLYYVSATFLQAWKIKNVCNKISEKLAQQSSVVFYTLPVVDGDGYDASLATSELCINRATAKVSDILWFRDNQRGCCIMPKQTVHITPWITFPDAPSWLPFAYDLPRPELLGHWESRSAKDRLYLLLETEIQPCRQNGYDEDVVKLEDYGKLMAWKIDSRLALLIESDLEHFTKLLMSTFLQNCFLINDQLSLLRIESINYEGKPQPFALVANHLRKSTRTTTQLTDEEWKRHLERLHALSVLANQATEFEYNKNLTEGKTGVVKPDLIPHDKKEATPVDIPIKSPIKSMHSPSKENVTITTTVASSPKAKSPVSSNFGSPAKQCEIKAEIISPVKNEATEATSPSKLGKLKTKPTEIRKPIAAATVTDGGRFKTTKVSEQSLNTPKITPTTMPTIPAPPQTLISLQTKASELEKLAAAEKSAVSIAPANAINATDSSDDNIPVSSKTSTTTALTAPPVAAAVSAIRDQTKRPSLRRSKDSFRQSKPLNVLVYADSVSARESTVVTLKDILEKDMYTIYAMTSQQVEQKHWLDNTALLVVCGTVASNIGEILVDYFLHGGKVLSLCSDILYFVLPTYRTAEVREHELVQFSYDKWQKVKMMHHIFCYQPSPVKKHFSTESDDSTPALSRRPALVCPRSIELKDLHGNSHNLDVKVLGLEETWNTPSLLLANSVKSGGTAVFSQIHLETNPTQFEADCAKFSILKQNEKIRLEIFSDLLSKHLNISVRWPETDVDVSHIIYKNSYFLGHHESKFQLMEKLKERMHSNNIINTSKLTMQFCEKTDSSPKANSNILPILIHSCPDDFSTVDYFDNLKTAYIGRLVIYTPIVSSSMHIVNELELSHGVAVLVRQQTEGQGRSNNQWLSPLGCAMFSIQLQISLDSPMGERLPLIQHIVATAVTNAMKSHNDYKVLDIAIKWPNDIYANGVTKIGGLIVKTTLNGSNAVVNIGCGINLNNSKPTTCINNLINDYNRANHKNLPSLEYEKFIAMVFNEIEDLIEKVQTGNFEYLYQLYYKLWLHSNKTIEIHDKDGIVKDAIITGIDNYGYLQVKLSNGVMESVQPDGNTFDILKGLIVPKFS